MKQIITGVICFALGVGVTVSAAPILTNVDVSALRAAFTTIRDVANTQIAYLNTLSPISSPVPPPPPPPSTGTKALPDTSTSAEYFRIETPGSYYNADVSFIANLDHFWGFSDKYPGHGLGVFLRFGTQYGPLYLGYYHQNNGQSVIKKKCPGGSTNGGTYYNISPYIPSGFQLKKDTLIRATVADEGSNVRINLYRDGVLLNSGLDTGQGCGVIKTAGKVGIRSDAAVFSWKNFQVR